MCTEKGKPRLSHFIFTSCLIDRHTPFLYSQAAKYRVIDSNNSPSASTHSQILVTLLLSHNLRIDISSSYDSIEWNGTGTGNEFFLYTCRCTCRCVNIWFEHASFQREILSYSTIRSAQWQRDDAKFTLCLHRSMCRSSERESIAIHWKSHRCECLCNDVITWCIVIATPYNRHDQHACRVYKQNGNNRLAFIRHCLLRTQNAESRE